MNKVDHDPKKFVKDAYGNLIPKSKAKAARNKIKTKLTWCASHCQFAWHK